MAPTFVPGIELSRRFYIEAVLPILAAHVPGLVHSAARLGSGSEVLGFDTERSGDHEWGPRVEIFVGDDDARSRATEIRRVLADTLPKRFLGYPTHFVAVESATGMMTDTDGPVEHRVFVTGVDAWYRDTLGFNPLDGVTTADWLATPTQRLAEQTAGVIFHDGLGVLVTARERLAWYPPDVWRHVLASQWQRISQQEAFVGRTGEVGDELGSAVVGARLVADLLHLAFLLERRWAPYHKWLGSAFARLDIAPALGPHLKATLRAGSWRTREQALGRAYETVATTQNALGLCARVDPAVRHYYDRPYIVIRGERFAEALRHSIGDPRLAARPLVGAVDQFVDSTDALIGLRRGHALAAAVTGD